LKKFYEDKNERTTPAGVYGILGILNPKKRRSAKELSRSFLEFDLRSRKKEGRGRSKRVKRPSPREKEWSAKTVASLKKEKHCRLPWGGCFLMPFQGERYAREGKVAAGMAVIDVDGE